MIHSLRQRHRWTVCALAVVLPVAFAIGIAARQTIPLANPAAINLGVGPDVDGTIVWSAPNGWPGKRISTTLWSDPLGALAVEFTFDELAGPDVLVYWLEGDTLLKDRLPENAQLLGPFSNREKLPFPGRPRGQRGRFLLYSLANHEVIATSRAVSLQPPAAALPAREGRP